MLKTALPSDVALPQENGPSPEEIRHQLQIILDSPAFHSSKRSRQFLEYVCEKSLSGEVGALKNERWRSRYSEDRHSPTLAKIRSFESEPAAVCKVRVDLSPGSYAPEFRYSAAKKNPAASPVVVAEQSRPRRLNPVVMADTISDRFRDRIGA